MAVALLATLLAVVQPAAGFVAPTLSRPKGISSSQTFSQHDHQPARSPRCSQSRAASKDEGAEGDSWAPSTAEEIPSDPHDVQVRNGVVSLSTRCCKQSADARKKFERREHQQVSSRASVVAVEPLEVLATDWLTLRLRLMSHRLTRNPCSRLPATALYSRLPSTRWTPLALAQNQIMMPPHLYPSATIANSWHVALERQQHLFYSSYQVPPLSPKLDDSRGWSESTTRKRRSAIRGSVRRI